MKDVRWFPAATLCALSGTVLHTSVLSSMDAAARAITAGAGVYLGSFLLVVAVFFTAPLVRRRTGGVSSEARTIAAIVPGMLCLVLCHAVFLPLGLWYTVLNGGWGLLPLLVTAQALGLAALAALLWQFSRRPGETAGGGREAPRLLGLRDPARMPPGWVPVVVHRPAAYLDALTDHPLEVDGAPVGAIAPGETLVIGLPPGEHTAWTSSGHLLAGSPLPFAAVPGRTVHLFVTASGRVAPWNPPAPRQEHAV
ncbi:hypothetical protein SUDANB121_05385 [Nocardiopsis dassonvillei]|uniref:hypothetical protein n=1 Tax=Nocardiopsis dassonvillei TaxID=2014 RepID=UPI003F567DB7